MSWLKPRLIWRLQLIIWRKRKRHSKTWVLLVWTIFRVFYLVCKILFRDLLTMQTSLTKCKWTDPIFRAICSMFWPKNKEIFQICCEQFVSRLMCLFPAAIQTQMIPKLKLVLALLKAVFPENGFWHICCCFALCTVKRRHLLQHDWRD